MRDRVRVAMRAVCLVTLLLSCRPPACLGAEDPVLRKKLGDFDAYMQKVVKDWNVPGVGVGVVVQGELVFAKGYGFRDYARKLPFTAQTTVPIASNTKLFTAIASGLLVEEGKLDWCESSCRPFASTTTTSPPR
jgi:CubicO group peptidase (beta-lactamase class C family)